MRLIILLLLFIVIGVFVFSNLQSVTLIFFGGSMIARLPLSIWIVIFTGAGLIGSLVIQLLSNLFRPSRAKVEPFKPSPSPRPKQPLNPLRSETSFRSPSNTQDWNRSTYQSTPPNEVDDWDIESPPVQTTPIRDYERERIQEKEPIQYTVPSFVQESPKEPPLEEKPLQEIENTLRKPIDETLQEFSFKKEPIVQDNQEESINYEVPQSPQNVSRSGSIYSYTYRESTKSQKQTPERVYDANFRVITPPIKENIDNNPRNSQTDPDEEEWI
ncbi:hypothetical protein C7H19_08830 [Aphanothece hegewaldii CCALA 016]|uniref:DUF1049 domain-containing protein n=1 Tax=Aphanothece hegewaldii CCALA 016 TaxID=2107694 RepID=A0A2T1LZ13_9CHRO|nr:hypothetical protein [Aphanothece hegewaldii]PSF37649.1 hypothetical protein C7H19_08830 [Aphanothece hegewaldii CCALA 016]